MTNQATDMTDKTHPDSGSAHIIRYALELGLRLIDKRLHNLPEFTND